MNVISAENVEFYYEAQANENNFILRNINLTIQKGEFISLLGPNGSGKSTLLRLLSGFLKSRMGNISVAGREITSYQRMELARKIAFVPQKNSAFFAFSVYEIVAMGRNPYLNNFGFESKSDRKLILNTLEMLDLDKLKEKGINEISGGEAQRAFLARALVQQADILILDEADAHLDLEHQINIYKILSRIRSEKEITIIAASHDLNLAAQFSERAIILNNGAIVTDTSIRHALTEKNIMKIFKVKSKLESSEDKLTVTILSEE